MERTSLNTECSLDELLGTLEGDLCPDRLIVKHTVRYDAKSFYSDVETQIRQILSVPLKNLVTITFEPENIYLRLRFFTASGQRPISVNGQRKPVRFVFYTLLITDIRVFFMLSPGLGLQGLPGSC